MFWRVLRCAREPSRYYLQGLRRQARACGRIACPSNCRCSERAAPRAGRFSSARDYVIPCCYLPRFPFKERGVFWITPPDSLVRRCYLRLWRLPPRRPRFSAIGPNSLRSIRLAPFRATVFPPEQLALTANKINIESCAALFARARACLCASCCAPARAHRLCRGPCLSSFPNSSTPVHAVRTV